MQSKVNIGFGKICVIFIFFLSNSICYGNKTFAEWRDESELAYNKGFYTKSARINTVLAGFSKYNRDFYFYKAAASWALSGNNEKAMECLQKSLAAGFSDQQQLKTDKDFINLHESEDFADLLKILNSQQGIRIEYAMWGIYFGVLLILCLYHLILSISLKSKSYFLYSLSIFFFAYFEVISNDDVSVFAQGLFFWTNYFNPEWNMFLWMGCISTLFQMIFADSFLELKIFQPKLRIVFVVFELLLLALSVIGLLNFPIRELCLISWCVAYATILYGAVKSYCMNNISSRFFLLGNLFLFTGVAMMVLYSQFEIGYDFTFLVFKSYHIGAVLFYLCLSMALGDHINILKRQKETAQDEALRLLEIKVKERTLELQEKNNLLSDKQKEIYDSLNYASRIQNALITNSNYIKRKLLELNRK
jgi:hypothetical protein